MSPMGLMDIALELKTSSMSDCLVYYCPLLTVTPKVSDSGFLLILPGDVSDQNCNLLYALPLNSDPFERTIKVSALKRKTFVSHPSIAFSNLASR